MTDFDPKAFVASRRRIKRLGWIALYGGLICLILDVTTPFPTPVRGELALGLWIPVMLLGIVLLIIGHRLPLRETLLLADRHGGVLDVPTIVREFAVDPEDGRRILEKACAKLGHAVHDDEPTGNRFYVFHPPMSESPPSE